ncbi:hypothetical protein ACFFLM_05750 [Deinococcus oregonensis]|uniref:Uncharacterized protein n=1 Tax=Deinococcus oregonensis TaxID=1805970 RepID=A0ABV6AVD9_9DEIO
MPQQHMEATGAETRSFACQHAEPGLQGLGFFLSRALVPLGRSLEAQLATRPAFGDPEPLSDNAHHLPLQWRLGLWSRLGVHHFFATTSFST